MSDRILAHVRDPRLLTPIELVEFNGRVGTGRPVHMSERVKAEKLE
jgi:hypothetical protein